MYSIDRVSRLASRAVASSSTNDERGRFPINRQSHSSDPRHRTTRACAFSLSTRVGQADHRSRLITEPPPSLPFPLNISLDDKKPCHSNTHRAPIERPIDRPDRSDRSTRTIDRPSARSRARRWIDPIDDDARVGGVDDDLDDDDDDAVVGGVEERGETGGESSGERVGGIGTTRYARWDDDAR